MKQLNKLQLKIIAVRGILAFADVFENENDDFHDEYVHWVGEKHVLLVPNEKETKIVIKELGRWVNLLHKRLSFLNNKLNELK